MTQCRYWTTIHEPELDPGTNMWTIPHKDRGICIRDGADTYGWVCDRRQHAKKQPKCFVQYVPREDPNLE